MSLLFNTDEENIVHTDVIGADDASALFHFVLQTFDLDAEEELIKRLEKNLEKTVHFCHGKRILS